MYFFCHVEVKFRQDFLSHITKDWYLCSMNERTSVQSLRCEPLPVVRMGFVGLGQRGRKTVERYTDIAGAEIKVLADLRQEAVEQANQQIALSGRSLAQCFSGKEAWREVCRHPEVDIVYICTDWQSHADIAIEALEHGKHVAVEVPLATTVEDCWRVVLAAERAQRHCFMTENCCYDWFHLATLELVLTGRLGRITHCEGAYIHDWRKLFGDGNFYEQSVRCGGNPYPTHAIGPIAQLLGFHRGDRMVRLVSMTGNALGADSLLGHSNSAIITTERGVTVTLHFDGTTPRPYSRLQTVCATEGFVQKYPIATIQIDDKLLTGQEAEDAMMRHLNTDAARAWKEGHRMGVDNEMNYAMDRRLIHCLRQGLPLDIDVYDAAEWSCLSELTRLSAAQGGAPIEIPDFTP